MNTNLFWLNKNIFWYDKERLYNWTYIWLNTKLFWLNEYIFSSNEFLFLQHFSHHVGVAFYVTVLKAFCFWCSLCKVIGNQGFFNWRSYNLLEIVTLYKKQYAFPTLCNALHSKNSKCLIYNLYILKVMFIYAWDFVNRW